MNQTQSAAQIETVRQAADALKADDPDTAEQLLEELLAELEQQAAPTAEQAARSEAARSLALQQARRRGRR